MTRHIALLRGINVGGRNKLPMSPLVAIFEDAGCTRVKTYIQSGNVVFDAGRPLAEHIAGVVTKSIADRFGFEIPVVTRSARELARIVKANPFLRAGTDERTLHVSFLANRPKATQVASLDPNHGAPDEFEVRGREIYLRCPNGVGRTKLSNAYFDSRLETTSTLRNWRTTLELLARAVG